MPAVRPFEATLSCHKAVAWPHLQSSAQLDDNSTRCSRGIRVDATSKASTERFIRCKGADVSAAAIDAELKASKGEA